MLKHALGDAQGSRLANGHPVGALNVGFGGIALGGGQHTHGKWRGHGLALERLTGRGSRLGGEWCRGHDRPSSLLSAASIRALASAMVAGAGPGSPRRTRYASCAGL